MQLIIRCIKNHSLFSLFLIGYLIFSFLTFRSYGITLDEHDVYSRGKLLYQTTFFPQTIEGKHAHNVLVSNKLDAEGSNLYDQFYPMMLYAFNPQESYEVYHLENLLFASIIFIFSYVVFYYFYKKQVLAILGPIFIFLTPRFFGDIPANPKDMPFAVMYFISIVSIIFLQHKNIFLKGIVLGILFAIAISMRIWGVSLFLLLFAYDLYIFIIQKKHSSSVLKFFISEALLLCIPVILTCGFLFATWPYLAEDFVHHGIEIIKSSQKFPWTGTILFMGKEIYSQNLQRRYLPVWFIISTPLFILFLTFMSIFTIKKRFKNGFFLLLISSLLFSFCLYFMLKPTVYDGIRHYMFLLPLAASLAALTFIEILLHIKNKKIKLLIAVIVAVNALLVIKEYTLLFPYQYIYFNELVGNLRGSYKRFETDYWGAGYKEAVTWLVKNSINSSQITVVTCDSNFSSTYFFKKNMLLIDNIQTANYFLCYTRYGKDKLQPSRRIIHIVSREGVPLIYVKQ